MSAWTNVEHQKPAPGVTVLLAVRSDHPHGPACTVTEGEYNASGFEVYAGIDRNRDAVTHWQPMPAAPKLD